MNKTTHRAGVFGATGYTGQELVELIAAHPRMQLAFATSESEAGQPIRGAGRSCGSYIAAADADATEADIVFVCLPTGKAGPWAVRAAEAGVLTVDLSSDLRSGESGAVYGLPELWREDLDGARLVANPGCYPTGALLALAPGVAEGVIDPARPVIIDAVSGVTGAGRSAGRDLLFGEMAEDFRPYGAGNRHRHVPEIGRGLSALGSAPPFVFTPHLLPIRRGILETIHVPLRDEMSVEDVVALWSRFYADEPFVEICGEEIPTMRDVVHRNVVSLGFTAVEGVAPMVTVFAALDNLLKGASGQALQNANILLGLDEREGLRA